LHDVSALVNTPSRLRSFAACLLRIGIVVTLVSVVAWTAFL
jgi:hypothetical protein